MRIISLLFSLFFTLTCFSQQKSYAKKVVDTLTSEYFAGRGVINNGEKKAANYIASEFNVFGVKQFNNTYFQEFLSPINTIYGKLSVRLDNTQLLAGRDYIVNAASGSINGTFKLVNYNNATIPTKKELLNLSKKGFFNNKFVVIDVKSEPKNTENLALLKNNVIGVAGLIFLEDKLTQHQSKTNNSYAIIHVLRDKIKLGNKTIILNINQQLKSDYNSQNVIGYIEGTQFKDSFIVLSAHYDHLGKMGNDVFFPGANDNASGVAMLLNMAKHYSKNPPTKSIIFIAFGAEEIGLVGSEYFVENPTIPLKQINFVFNMDLMGTGSKGATIVNGSIYTNHFNKLIAINDKKGYLPVIKKRGKAANSDHYWFSEKGIPAFFIYLMGGINAYHDIDDVSETLPLTKYNDSFMLIRDFIDDL